MAWQGRRSDASATAVLGLQGLQALSPRRWPPLGAFIKLPALRVVHDFPFRPLRNNWTDVKSNAFGNARLYVVQTNVETVKRCLLMTTAPGDLVLDPTCGSASTAYISEQWGRRWISIDTSRVPLALA